MSMHALRSHTPKFLLIAFVLLALPIVAACGPAASTAPTTAPTAEATTAPTTAPATEVMETPTAETMATSAGETMETPSGEGIETPSTETMENPMTGTANADLTVYVEPDTTTDQVASVSSGDTLTLLGRRSVDSTEWLYVQTAGGDEGWGEAANVDTTGDTTTLPEQ